MATEKFEHAARGEGGDHAGATELEELAGPSDPNEHVWAGAITVRGHGAAGDIGGRRRHRQP